jgi:predicted ABC-type transport system involved in lysophospholipase L1 biosynthesis ATPase subunit
MKLKNEQDYSSWEVGDVTQTNHLPSQISGGEQQRVAVAEH